MALACPVKTQKRLRALRREPMIEVARLPFLSDKDCAISEVKIPIPSRTGFRRPAYPDQKPVRACYPVWPGPRPQPHRPARRFSNLPVCSLRHSPLNRKDAEPLPALSIRSLRCIEPPGRGSWVSANLPPPRFPTRTCGTAKIRNPTCTGCDQRTCHTPDL